MFLGRNKVMEMLTLKDMVSFTCCLPGKYDGIKDHFPILENQIKEFTFWHDFTYSGVG